MTNIASDFFTRELYSILLRNKTDIVVHSAKDFPYPLPQGFEVICLFEAVDKTDSLIIIWNNLLIVILEDKYELFSSYDIPKSYGKVAFYEEDNIFYDDLLDQQYLSRYKAEKKYVVKRKVNHSYNQGEINELIYRAAIKRQHIVRLKGRDPMFFAHGGEEIDFLKSRFVKIDVISGVSLDTALETSTHITLIPKRIFPRQLHLWCHWIIIIAHQKYFS